MDQPTPDRPIPEAPPTPEPIPKAIPVRPAKRDARVETRLRTLVGPSVPVVAWARAWVSRERRAHRLLAARTLDFVVLTDRDLHLFSSGFLTRRPRRLVYTAALDRLLVVDHDVPRGRRLRIRSGRDHALRLELPATARATALADALVASANTEQR